MLVLEETFDRLRTFVTHYTFRDQSEEINFFKNVKPHIFSWLLYYGQLHAMEARMPVGSRADQRKYLVEALGRIKYFFDMNSEFYCYYRSGSTHLDDYYFLRGKADIQPITDNICFERDVEFSTGYDLKVSTILANEKLTNYINDRLSILSCREDPPVSKMKLAWTGKKAELVEQVYAWEEAKCFNYGHANIKQLAGYIEEVFNIDLGDFYHAFLEMRERKGSRTLFLDKLIKLLNDRMDETDKK